MARRGAASSALPSSHLSARTRMRLARLVCDVAVHVVCECACVCVCVQVSQLLAGGYNTLVMRVKVDIVSS
jgi:hypothetical protein